MKNLYWKSIHFQCYIEKAKQIKEAINLKAGVADADVMDFFEDYNQQEEADEGNIFFFLILSLLQPCF